MLTHLLNKLTDYFVGAVATTINDTMFAILKERHVTHMIEDYFAVDIDESGSYIISYDGEELIELTKLESDNITYHVVKRLDKEDNDE